MQDSFGDIYLEEWVLTNSEGVQNLKEKDVLNFREASKVKKEKWYTKAKERVLELGDLVLIKKSGMSDNLSQSWVGPFPIHKVNSPLS